MSNQKFSIKHSLEPKKNNSEVFQRQMVLAEMYQNDPSLALITDSSEVIGTNLHDPFRTLVSVNDKMQIPFKVGVHKAVGGDHDFPNPGDILCAALAACFESTVRMIANRLGIEIVETRVKASAKVDVRGTLMIDKSVPVGFQSMHLEVVLVTHNLNESLLNTLIGGAKHCCIVFQTIKQGIPTTLNVNFETMAKNNNSKI
jgi:uncharacterized OsmC-like protein